MWPAGMADATGNEVKTMFAINFETAYNVARPVYSHMCGRGKGRIVLMGARPALEPAAAKTSVAYALSKSLLFKLAEILNADAEGKDVVTHVVVPSTIDTPNNRKWMPNADFDSWVKAGAAGGDLRFHLFGCGAPVHRSGVEGV